MNPEFSGQKENEAGAGGALRDVAARWIVRRDRKLTAAEKVELEAWIAADARHGAALEQAEASWRNFRELGAAVRRAPVASGRTAKPRWAQVALGGLAAAVLTLGWVAFERGTGRGQERAGAEEGDKVAVTTPAGATGATALVRRLADGSVAQLKAGAEIVEEYSPEARRVRLLRGEAFFTVMKDKTRPFFVEVGAVTVRAVGTAFAVRFDPHAVDVLVTEGTVQVTPPTVGTGGNEGGEQAAAVGEGAPATVGQERGGTALVDAGHRAVVARVAEFKAPAVVVSAVSATEMAKALAWSAPMLDLAGATLGELVPIFVQRTGRKIEIADAELNGVRIGGRFPTDDLDGFVRVLEEIYEVRSERRADGGIVLRKAR